MERGLLAWIHASLTQVLLALLNDNFHWSRQSASIVGEDSFSSGIFLSLEVIWKALTKTEVRAGLEFSLESTNSSKRECFKEVHLF